MLGAIQAGAVLAMLGGSLRSRACAWLRAVLARFRSLAAWIAPARGGAGVVAPVRAEGSHPMLRIYPVLLQLVVSVRPLVAQLERHDADLARQCRRALTSAPLNVAEGSYSRGKNRPARYHTALGSLREALACFEVAEALGYLPALEPALRARFDRVLGTLVRLVGGH